MRLDLKRLRQWALMLRARLTLHLPNDEYGLPAARSMAAVVIALMLAASAGAGAAWFMDEQPESHTELTAVVYEADDDGVDEAEAVAAPDEVEAEPVRRLRTQLNREDWNLMVKLIRAEAPREPFDGKVAVAAVVFNRMEDPDFPDTLHGVVFARWQFEPVGNGAIWRMEPTAEDHRALQAALEGRDPTGGAIYFFNHNTVSNPWLWARPHAITIGAHRFAF